MSRSEEEVREAVEEGGFVQKPLDRKNALRLGDGRLPFEVRIKNGSMD